MTDIFFPDGASSPLLLERTQKSPWSTLRVLSSRPALLQEEKKNQNSFTDVDVRHKIFLHSQTSRFLRLILFALFRVNWIWDGGRIGHWCSFSCWFILSHHQPVCPLLAPHLIHQLRSIRRLCSEGSRGKPTTSSRYVNACSFDVIGSMYVLTSGRG